MTTPVTDPTEIHPEFGLAKHGHETLPCPFCGDTKIWLHAELRPGLDLSDPEAHAFWFMCGSCASHGGWGKSVSSALRWWNMRPAAQ